MPPTPSHARLDTVHSLCSGVLDETDHPDSDSAPSASCRSLREAPASTGQPHGPRGCHVLLAQRRGSCQESDRGAWVMVKRRGAFLALRTAYRKWMHPPSLG